MIVRDITASCVCARAGARMWMHAFGLVVNYIVNRLLGSTLAFKGVTYMQCHGCNVLVSTDNDAITLRTHACLWYNYDVILRHGRTGVQKMLACMLVCECACIK